MRGKNYSQSIAISKDIFERKPFRDITFTSETFATETVCLFYYKAFKNIFISVLKILMSFFMIVLLRIVSSARKHTGLYHKGPHLVSEKDLF